MHDDFLEFLSDRSPAAFVTVSADATVTGWSLGAQRLLAYSADEVMGRPFPSLAEEPQPVEAAFATVRHRPTVQTICLNTKLIGKHGNGAPVFLCVDAFRDHSQNVQRFVVTARDLLSVAFGPGSDHDLARIATPDSGALRTLTPRQRLVLELIARGHSTREIAGRLNRSVKTIETHRAQLMKRLNIFHVPGLVRFAIRAGLVTLE